MEGDIKWFKIKPEMSFWTQGIALNCKPLCFHMFPTLNAFFWCNTVLVSAICPEVTESKQLNLCSPFQYIKFWITLLFFFCFLKLWVISQYKIICNVIGKKRREYTYIERETEHFLHKFDDMIKVWSCCLILFLFFYANTMILWFIFYCQCVLDHFLQF